ncbi:Aste57867_9051 [Aphanomyces stellatus]|uniref:Aste57867_9051 protein n=1 Tax=Aphanomyces stellatus TaxID=120398 RepID=A0A485KM87_9STRA|nr:hypothetical protein As57867_009015 [Aphanomyces stellatus]VFT85935.1 Aste57867_9051 [Aphanomyces stellatus]
MRPSIDVGPSWTSYSLPVTCPLTGAHWMVTKRYRQVYALRQTLQQIHTKAPAAIQRLLEYVLNLPFPDKEVLTRLVRGKETSGMRRRRQHAFLSFMDALMHVRAIAPEHRRLVEGEDLVSALDTFVTQPRAVKATMFDVSSASAFVLRVPPPPSVREATAATTMYTLSLPSLHASIPSWTFQSRYSSCRAFRDALIDLGRQIKTQPSLVHLSWLLETVTSLPFPKRRWRADSAAVIRDRQEGLERFMSAVMTFAWVCRHRSAVTAENAPLAMAMGGVLAYIESFVPPPPPRTESDIDCVICWDVFSDDYVDVHTLACGHRFHRACFTTWVAQRPICPVCCRAVDASRRQVLPVVNRLPRGFDWFMWTLLVVILVVTSGSAVVVYYLARALLVVVGRCLQLVM